MSSRRKDSIGGAGELEEGQQVVGDRYQLLEKLGEGSQGVTWRARDQQSESVVAVKVLSLASATDWKQVDLFEREAKTLRHLNVPAIPAYVDFHHDDRGHFYLVRELVEGSSLEELIEDGKRFSEEEVEAKLLEVLEVLDYIHSLDPPVIHRDLKPSNLILRNDGTLALIDFGTVQHTISPQGGSTIVGTTGYMPPEQLMGRAEPGSDLYALGATVVRLLTHQHPSDLPVDRMRLKWRSAARVDERLARVVDRMIEPMLEDRYKTGAEVRAALTATKSTKKASRTKPSEAANQWPTTPIPRERAVSARGGRSGRAHWWRSWQVVIPIVACSVAVMIGGFLQASTQEPNRTATDTRGNTVNDEQAEADSWNGVTTLNCSGRMTLKNRRVRMDGVVIDMDAGCQLTLVNCNLAGTMAVQVGGAAELTVIGGTLYGTDAAITARSNAVVSIEHATTISGRIYGLRAHELSVVRLNGVEFEHHGHNGSVQRGASAIRIDSAGAYLGEPGTIEVEDSSIDWEGAGIRAYGGSLRLDNVAVRVRASLRRSKSTALFVGGEAQVTVTKGSLAGSEAVVAKDSARVTLQRVRVAGAVIADPSASVTGAE